MNELLLWQCLSGPKESRSRMMRHSRAPQSSPRRSGSWRRAARRAPRRAPPCWPAARAWPACPCRTVPAWRSPLPGGTCSSHSARAATLGDAERAAQGAAASSACSSSSSRELWGQSQGWSCASPANCPAWGRHTQLGTGQELLLLEMSQNFTNWHGSALNHSAVVPLCVIFH